MDLFENFTMELRGEGQSQSRASVASLHGQAFDKLLMAAWWIRIIPGVGCTYSDCYHVCLSVSVIVSFLNR